MPLLVFGLLAFCLGLLLLALLALPKIPRQQSLELLVLKFFIRPQEFRLVPDRGMADQRRTSRQESNSEVEAGYEGSRGGISNGSQLQ